MCKSGVEWPIGIGPPTRRAQETEQPRVLFNAETDAETT